MNSSYKIELISGIILAFLALIRFSSPYIAEYILYPVGRFLKKRIGKEKLNLEVVNSGRAINNILLELRVKTDSDRASIFLFHNGQHFNPKIINNSIWKFTCAYEVCKVGVTYESNNMQNLLVTNYLNLIESLWNKLDRGFEKYPCQNCPIECEKSKNLIVVIDTDTIPYGNVKNMFEVQGIKKFILSPIIINEDYVGFVSLSYSSNFTFGSQSINTNPKGLKIICETANTIGYYLTQKN